MFNSLNTNILVYYVGNLKNDGYTTDLDFLINGFIMLTNEILKEPEKFWECVNQGLPYKLLSVKIKIVDKCNLRCKICNHWRHYVEALPFDFYKPVIKDWVELGCQKIHFTGGGPMLYPILLSLMEFIRQCDDNNKISMTTNATLIDDKVAKALSHLG